MPPRAIEWLALLPRLAAIGLVAVAGMLRMPDPGRDGIAAMVRSAEDLAYFEAFVPARAKLETAFRAAKRLPDPALMALCLDRIGSVLDFEGQTIAGAERHQRALALAREIGSRTLAASIIASIGLGHWRQSEYVAALTALHEALAVQQELGDLAGEARTLVFIGRVHFKKAEYLEAEQAYRRAVAILGRTGDRRWLSITLEDVGDVALEQGQFVNALEAFERALAARRDIGDTAGEVYMLNVVGRSYLLQGAYRQALVWFARARALSEPTGDRAGLALALYHMGIAHDELSEPAEALRFYADALTLKQELGDRRQQAWILRHIAAVHAVQRDFSAALEANRRAIRIWEEIRDPRGIATALSMAGAINFELGQYEASAESFRRASELLGTSHPPYLAPALAGMGRAYAAARDERRALDYGRRAVDIALRGPADVQWTTIRSLGWIERQLGRRDAALASYLKSLAIIETLRGRVVSSADARAGFLEGKQTVYGDTVALLFELGRFDQALEVAERSRARAFLDLLSGRDVSVTPVNRVAQLSTAPSLRLEEARHEARRTGATILEYFSTADQLFIWVVAPDGRIRAAAVRISTRELSELVGAVRVLLEKDAERAGSRPLLRRLHRVLIEPVAELLPAHPDRLVTIVPHGPLFLLSFAALIDASGGYLVERHTLAYSPSISVLRYTGRNRARVRNPTAPRVLVIGNPSMPADGDREPLPPLPGAESEAHAIGRLYPSDRVTALTGARARESTVRALASEQTIIHLATHAVIFDDDPMGGYLALAPGRGPGVVSPPDREAEPGARDPLGDGLLTVAEVFGLELHTELVTLSACNTGIGHVSGEGVVGLSRAFIYAGTASVLVSLWRVADSVAAAKMERFYRGLIRSGGNKAAALAAAQREIIALLREGKIESPSGRALAEDPLLWAPFVLVGEAR